MIRSIHPLAGAVAVLTIATFWSSTVLVELFGSPAAIAAVKTAILWGFLVLIPALVAAGGSGVALARRRGGGLVERKRRRMPFIAGNGVMILVPAAVYLASKAAAGEFDGTFAVVQAIELVAGATNLVLLGLQMRDGLRMSKRRLRQPTTAPGEA